LATVITAGAYEGERQKAREADEQRALRTSSAASPNSNASAPRRTHRQARAAVEQLVKIGEQELAGRPDLEALRWRLLEAALAYYQSFHRTSTAATPRSRPTSSPAAPGSRPSSPS